jgi:hypothetical protein
VKEARTTPTAPATANRIRGNPEEENVDLSICFNFESISERSACVDSQPSKQRRGRDLINVRIENPVIPDASKHKSATLSNDDTSI